MSSDQIVSVIMPVYDTPVAFLQEAVASVLSQTYRHWELLLVDDGSGDAARECSQNLCEHDKERIRYCEHEGHANKGAGASRNLGIELAQGQYVAFLDADDVWLTNKLARQIALLDAHPEAGMLYGNTEYWRSWQPSHRAPGKDYVPRLELSANRVFNPPELLTRYLRGSAPVPHMSSIVVRKTVLERVGAFVDSFKDVYEDQIFIARMCLSVPVYVSDEIWDRYRQWEDSSYTTAERTGVSHRARIAYLQWLSAHIESRAVKDPKLRSALAEAIAVANSTNALDPRKLRPFLRRMGRKIRQRLYGDRP